MIKISKRLETISSLVPVNSNVIDIGCDHGLLSIYLLEKNISNKVIASDINENALNNAKENIRKNNVNIETRLGNGLDVLKKEDNIDTIIISGMGAHTIIGMLKNNQEKLRNINTIIIQSNTKLLFLRKEMVNLKYYISDEELVNDNNKIYTIIKYEKGYKRYNKRELYFGPILLKKNSELFKEKNKKELEKLNLLLKLLPKNKIIDRLKIKREISLYK